MGSRFKIEARGSTPSREAIGGITTFLAMAYIAVANPAILAEAGVPFQAALTSTCLGAALMTIVMGIAANRPIALAPGMGVNAIVAYAVCIGMGVDWRVAMSVVFIEGIVIFILVLCGLRRAIMQAIPPELRLAIGIGVGMLVALIGLKGGGVVVSDAATFVALGNLASSACVVSLVSIVVAVVLRQLLRHVRPRAAFQIVCPRCALGRGGLFERTIFQASVRHLHEETHMKFENLTAEQKEKALACKTPEELIELAKSEGVALTDAQLESISGGGWNEPSCGDDTAWTYAC